MLMWAVRGGSKRIAKLCLRNGMDINAYNKNGQTAVHQIISENYFGQDVLLNICYPKVRGHDHRIFLGLHLLWRQQGLEELIA